MPSAVPGGYVRGGDVQRGHPVASSTAATLDPPPNHPRPRQQRHFLQPSTSTATAMATSHATILRCRANAGKTVVVLWPRSTAAALHSPRSHVRRADVRCGHPAASSAATGPAHPPLLPLTAVHRGNVLYGYPWPRPQRRLPLPLPLSLYPWDLVRSHIPNGRPPARPRPKRRHLCGHALDCPRLQPTFAAVTWPRPRRRAPLPVLTLPSFLPPPPLPLFLPLRPRVQRWVSHGRPRGHDRGNIPPRASCAATSTGATTSAAVPWPRP